jgi:purine-binding chemotaxis protein CheW
VSSTRMLTVRLPIGRFAVPISWIEEVVRFAELTPLPGAPPSCLGVLNLRGDILPVLEPVAWLGEAPPVRGIDDQLVIALLSGRKVAFVVDHVIEVRDVPEVRVEALSLHLTSSRWVQGLFSENGDVYVVVDLPALLADADAHGLREAEETFLREDAEA